MSLATLRLRWGAGQDGLKVHCIVGLFGGRIFRPQNSSTMHFDNHLDPISSATSKWKIASCLYLMNKMQRNIIKKRRWAIFRWVSPLNRFFLFISSSIIVLLFRGTQSRIVKSTLRNICHLCCLYGQIDESTICSCAWNSVIQDPVVQKEDNATGFTNSYPPDSDLSSG